MKKIITFMTWIKGACRDSAFDGGGEDFDISSEEDKQNVKSDGGKIYAREKRRKWQFQHMSILWNREEVVIIVGHSRITLILRKVPTILGHNLSLVTLLLTNLVGRLKMMSWKLINSRISMMHKHKRQQLLHKCICYFAYSILMQNSEISDP